VAKVVGTAAGRLEGRERRGFVEFRGVPFAEPPMGGLRFRPPTPVKPWSGVRSAETNGPSAPQVGPVNRVIRTLIGAAGSKQSQDCLYLNVWTPRADKRRRPVLLWIHGGAFILGSGTTPVYSGARLATRGNVVVVTINYRLGALGFLSFAGLTSGSDPAPANLGLRDQIAALEWVRDNIADFGGDPENVTLFGESAGAMSTGTLLGVPRARGLFQRAILQSGAAHNVSSAELASRIAAHYVEALGLTGSYEKGLGERSVTELMAAQARTTARFGLADGVMAWQPCVDGDLIPEQPLAAIGRGLSADVPVLVGTNRDEWKLFIAADPRGLRLDERGFRDRLDRVMPGEDGDGKAVSALAARAYARVVGPRGLEPSERWAAFQSDRIFHHPATCLLEKQSDHQPNTFAYLFEWSPPIVGRWLGACHGLELPFVFGGVKTALVRAGLGATRGAQHLSSRMQDAWVAFAKNGDPSHAKLPEWPSYSRFARNTMSFNTECTLRGDPHERGRTFWTPLASPGETRWL
jgi:para-nitrobenzyl esterase